MKSRFTVVLIASLLLSSPVAQRARAGQPEGSSPPLADRQGTLRALAGFVDATAQGALEGAMDDVRHGDPSAARLLSTVRSVAEDAQRLHRRLGEPPRSGNAARAQVRALADQVRAARAAIRAAAALESTWDEWDAITDALQRMTTVLEGGEAEVPPPFVVPALSGAPLEEFRRLARDLDVAAARAHHRAGRELSAYPGRGQQFLGEMRYFAAQGRALHVQADAGVVDPQVLGPVVDRILREAREADHDMRDAAVFEDTWDDTGQIIAILERMTTLVRS
jgi:hypothetical protein